jgi:hypothetical protein
MPAIHLLVNYKPSHGYTQYCYIENPELSGLGKAKARGETGKELFVTNKETLQNPGQNPIIISNRKYYKEGRI